MIKIKIFKTSNFSIINQCYLIYKNNIGILVDPSWDYNLINTFLIENDIALKGVLLTHSHDDHTNLANEFAVKKNVPVFMTAQEIEFSGFECQNLRSITSSNEIQISDFNITPIFTPGHTPGSVCYLIENNIFSGDTIFIEGVGVCSTKGGDVDKMWESVQNLKNTLPENTFFFPGHSFGELPGKNLIFLLKNNIYFQIKEKDHFVSFRMRKNQPNLFYFK
ncbi:MAG: MBL fold metallo-hydrolase [Flavobacterium circumlabens]|uniref:Glyoxylase-like metal-dependent hydrolase (Beta-lactamase superfamily II) n=1 Tax=Flavobacterium circumlabens TaxID=2133765 RepID=A0A4Y7UCL9_9FLAO|nr:MBL fold metallo-hydrolase [Flavobacterium circumlabens]TCN57657.1 glyoxylase-like metal-dependent hydrolase (beta-lactamase superfamily II) [Flavobacterium circumlabens]TEB43961.1 MBL fold metallo-hydrolase [Flavobacterium circumlabens]